MKRILFFALALGLVMSCEKEVEPIKYADVKVGLSLYGENLSSHSFGRTNTDVALWNHILSPLVTMHVRLRHQGGGASIESKVTYAELSALTFSLEVGAEYIVEIDPFGPYIHDGLVVYGTSEVFTVEEGVTQEVIVNGISDQYLILVDKESIPTADIPMYDYRSTLTGTFNTAELYETDQFWYIYQGVGVEQEKYLRIRVMPDTYYIDNPEPNVIYYVSYAEAFSISVGLGLPTWTKVIGIGGN